MKKILAVAVHPDDETLGCGGALLKHKNNGDDIYWLIITSIDVENGWEKDKVESRRREIDSVSKMYGFCVTHSLNFPTTRLDTIPMKDLISEISKIIQKVEPDIIYVPNRSDIHTDHQVAFKAIMSCTKVFRNSFIRKILMYECLSETEFSPSLQTDVFIPNVFVDITGFLEEKIKIMKMYRGEMGTFPFPRSEENIRALAMYRGATAGVEAAEAFVLLKEVL
jgi:LmbE family N-acetylglucosaminyl deacetylase